MTNTTDMQLLHFENLAQRVLYRFAFSFADFIPLASEEAGIDAQRVCYDFCRALVEGIAADPTLAGVTTDHADEWMGAHQVLRMKPELYKVRNACQKAFGDLAGLLFAAGTHGERQGGCLAVGKEKAPRLTKKALGTFLELLGRYGLHAEEKGDTLTFAFPDCPDAVEALRLLAAKCGRMPCPENEQVRRFALWIHSDDYTWFLKKIETLLNLEEGFLDRIGEKYLARSYRPVFAIDEYRTGYKYLKDISGLSIEFDTLWPTVRFVNATSIGIKAALEHAGELGGEIQRQLVRFCRPCNDCMGCTKGGKNAQFTVALSLDGEERRLCPEFVQMEWYNGDISLEKIDFLLELNELQERFGRNRRKQ